MARFFGLIAFASTLVSCSGVCLDRDGDGFCGTEDCDDSDVTVHSNAQEIWYDGIDQNCDNNDQDQDGDGYDLSEDCDDTDESRNPGAEEIWYDGTDQDCDNGDDYDQDADGHQAQEHGGDDCDDTDPNAHPGRPETYYDGVDGDCLGGDDYDQDGDGHAVSGVGGDCDDEDPEVFPGAFERIGDDLDQDCDGGVDSAEATVLSLAGSSGLLGPRIAENNQGVWIAFLAQDQAASGQPGIYEVLFDPTAIEQGSQLVQDRAFSNSSLALQDRYDFTAMDDTLLHAFGFNGSDNGEPYVYAGVMTRESTSSSTNYQGTFLSLDPNYVVDDIHFNQHNATAAVAFCSLDHLSWLMWGTPTQFASANESGLSGAVFGDVCAADAKSKRLHLVDTVDQTYDIYKKKPNTYNFTRHSGRSVAPLDLDWSDNGGRDFVVGAMDDNGVWLRKKSQEVFFSTTGSPIWTRVHSEGDLFFAIYLTEAGEAFLLWGDTSNAVESQLDFGIGSIEQADVFLTSEGELVIAASSATEAALMHLGL